MRLTLWAALALAVCACSDSTSSSGGSLSASDASDISVAESDEVEQAVSAVTSPASLAAESPTAPGCATVDNETDSDGDFQPDNATYTFALPACHFTGFRGGSLDVTGTIALSDPTPSAPDLAVVATLTDFRVHQPGPAAHLFGGAEWHPYAHRQRAGRFAQQPGDRRAEPAQPRRRDGGAQPAAHVHPGGG
jgi:hypothetical protein